VVHYLPGKMGALETGVDKRVSPRFLQGLQMRESGEEYFVVLMHRITLHLQ